jgi:acyl carrier protein
VKNQLKLILSRIKENPALAETITDESHLMKDVGLTSLDMMYLLLELEEEFDIEIDISKINIEVFSSLNNLSSFVQSMKQ